MDNIAKMFSDRPPKELAEILELIDLLKEKPRMKFSEAAKKLNLAMSTSHDRWKMIDARLRMTATFEPKIDKLPMPTIKCPKCRSTDTDPQFTSTDGFGMQLVGLVCKKCGNKARRSQLPKSAIAAVELAAVGGEL